MCSISRRCLRPVLTGGGPRSEMHPCPIVRDLKHFQRKRLRLGLDWAGAQRRRYLLILKPRLYRLIEARGARHCGLSKSAQLLQQQLGPLSADGRKDERPRASQRRCQGPARYLAAGPWSRLEDWHLVICRTGLAGPPVALVCVVIEGAGQALIWLTQHPCFPSRARRSRLRAGLHRLVTYFESFASTCSTFRTLPIASLQ